MQRIRNAVLFHGMSNGELEEALVSLRAEEKSFRKGHILLHAGKTTTRIGLVLEGSVTIESNDLWGNRTILSLLGPGQIFAETYALLKTEPLLVDVTASEDGSVLFLDLSSLQEPSAASWQLRLVRNLLTISAQKNLLLSSRSFHTSSKSIRGRIMAYLDTLSLQKKSTVFEIPFDRQQLADYLNVERSALSKELGRMQKEGILTTRKHHFEIHARDRKENSL